MLEHPTHGKFLAIDLAQHAGQRLRREGAPLAMEVLDALCYLVDLECAAAIRI